MEDVIKGKHKYKNLEAADWGGGGPGRGAVCAGDFDLCTAAFDGDREEIQAILMKIQEFHGRDYGGAPQLPVETLKETDLSDEIPSLEEISF